MQPRSRSGFFPQSLHMILLQSAKLELSVPLGRPGAVAIGRSFSATDFMATYPHYWAPRPDSQVFFFKARTSHSRQAHACETSENSPGAANSFGSSRKQHVRLRRPGSMAGYLNTTSKASPSSISPRRKKNSPRLRCLRKNHSRSLLIRSQRRRLPVKPWEKLPQPPTGLQPGMARRLSRLLSHHPQRSHLDGTGNPWFAADSPSRRSSRRNRDCRAMPNAKSIQGASSPPASLTMLGQSEVFSSSSTIVRLGTLYSWDHTENHRERFHRPAKEKHRASKTGSFSPRPTHHRLTPAMAISPASNNQAHRSNIGTYVAPRKSEKRDAKTIAHPTPVDLDQEARVDRP